MKEYNDNYYGFARAEMLDFLPKNAKKILDIGCGNGNFGKVAKEQLTKTEVYGIEPIEKAEKKAKEILDKTFCGLFNEELVHKHFQNTRFDAIFFNDVLEHIAEPWDTLKLASSILSKDGYIIASIPNILYYYEFIDMLKSKDWKYKDGGIFDITHLRFFTKKSIKRLFEETGFEIVQMNGLHPLKSKKFELLNLLTLKKYDEMRYMQWGVKARIKKR